MGFRPNLPESLKDTLERTDELGAEFYKRVGYTSKSAFVAQAVKEKIQKEKEVLDE